MKEYVLRPTGGSGQFQIDYPASLNPQQLEVVMAGDGPILVIAGAGSGKTRTLTYRVARLIESGVPPQQILLLTFTNKAAREMLGRVEALARADLRITGGTFHHVGHRVLRRHAAKVGLPENFTILDREDARELLDEIASGTRTKKSPKGAVLLEMHSYAVNTDTSLRRLLGERYPVFFEVQEEILRVLDQYERRKRRLGLVDFDDLLTGWRTLVARDEEVREEQHRLWRYILVDEFQDTNVLQADIVEAIAGPDGNLMVVGDDAQSIYSFRGAHFGNIIGFPDRFPRARVFKLETNYRSVPEVLDLANSSIVNNTRQYPKVLRAVLPPGEKPEVVTCGDVQEQARFVTQRITDFLEEGADLREIAVLYRAHWHSMEVQMELTRAGIPFQVRSGLRFFEQAHIKDAAAYLKLVSNPKDELSWKRVLKLCPRIGKATAQKIWTALEERGDPLGSLRSEELLRLVPSGARSGWRDLTSLLETLNDPDMRRSPAAMIRSVLAGGYESYLTSQYVNAFARIDDLKRLADYSIRYQDVESLLAELALSNTVAGREAIAAEEGDEQLVLSTIHQAKGLEWRAVFIIWAVEGKIPDARAVREEGGEEEERRLFYVAATRAKERLSIVYPILAEERNMSGVLQRPSRFVEELDASTFEQVQITHYGY